MGTDLLTVGFLLGVTHRRVSALFQQRLQKYDITPEQWSVLFHVTRKEGMIQKSIAEVTYKDNPTVTRILHQLEQKDYVNRVPDKQDRRSLRIYSTEQGQRLIQKTASIEDTITQEIKDCIGEDKHNELLDILIQINRELKQQ